MMWCPMQFNLQGSHAYASFNLELAAAWDNKCPASWQWPDVCMFSWMLGIKKVLCPKLPFDKSWKITYAKTLRKPHWQELLTRAYACQCFAYAAGPYKGLPSWHDYRGLERGSPWIFDIWNPIKNGIQNLLTGARFLPSQHGFIICFPFIVCWNYLLGCS